MSQRHDLEVICALAIHQQKREVPEWHSANGFADRKSAYRFADRWTVLDQTDCSLDLGPQAVTQAELSRSYQRM